jgi:hypothetical protein
LPLEEKFTWVALYLVFEMLGGMPWIETARSRTDGTGALTQRIVDLRNGLEPASRPQAERACHP